MDLEVELAGLMTDEVPWRCPDMLRQDAAYLASLFADCSKVAMSPPAFRTDPQVVALRDMYPRTIAEVVARYEAVVHMIALDD
jgi:hypothetical protein